jgi:hypothetical protein
MYEEVIYSIYLSDLIPERQAEIKKIVGEIQAADWDVIPLAEINLGMREKGDE